MTATRTIPFGRPWITDDERQAVMGVLDGPILTHGPQGKAFEAEFAASLGPGAHAVSVSSCMAALHLSYLYLGLGPGDEVIVPAQTHTATAHAVEWVGARPVFVDCDPATGNVTADRVAEAVTARTRAVSVVHFGGIPCEMDAIMEVAREHELRVVEDCAIALGARLRGTHVGLFGDAGCFSFYPVKHITTAEGGMYVSRHADAAQRVASLRAFGVDRTHGERTIPGMYDVPTLGLNYRMSELQAAMGRTQLTRLDEGLRRRRANFLALKGGLAELRGVRVVDSTSPQAESSFYSLSAVLDGPYRGRRDEVVTRLNAVGVGTSIYYPQPVPRMRYYREKYGYNAADFPHAETISDHSFALPVGPHVTLDDAEYMAAAVGRVLRELSQ